MSKHFACGDVVEGCAVKFSADTEEEVLAKVGAHAKDHGLTEITPDVLAKVKAAIQTR